MAEHGWELVTAERWEEGGLEGNRYILKRMVEKTLSIKEDREEIQQAMNELQAELIHLQSVCKHPNIKVVGGSKEDGYEVFDCPDCGMVSMKGQRW